MPKVRRVLKGRSQQLQAVAKLQPIPAIHVPPAPLAVPAGLQQLARRDHILSTHANARGPHPIADHDPAYSLQLLVQRPSRTGPPRYGFHPGGSHPPDGHVLSDSDLPRRDHRPVESPQIPGHARVRELQAAAASTGGRRARDSSDALPHASLHRYGARRIPGPLPAVQGQSLADAQQHVRLRAGESRSQRHQLATFD